MKYGPMPKRISIGEKYGPAMEITDPDDAKEYFEACVQHTMLHGVSREEAERIERVNLGYYAGYYDHETRLRVERLFACVHPIFGSAVNGVPTVNELVEMGKCLVQQN